MFNGIPYRRGRDAQDYYVPSVINFSWFGNSMGAVVAGSFTSLISLVTGIVLFFTDGIIAGIVGLLVSAVCSIPALNHVGYSVLANISDIDPLEKRYYRMSKGSRKRYKRYVIAGYGSAEAARTATELFKRYEDTSEADAVAKRIEESIKEMNNEIKTFDDTKRLMEESMKGIDYAN
jgi:hypothetical protein